MREHTLKPYLTSELSKALDSPLRIAMLAWFAKIGISGQVWSIIAAHTVLTIPFAMAIIRLRLNEMDESLEAAAWNLGASEWRAVREVIIPFARPAILTALLGYAAVAVGLLYDLGLPWHIWHPAISPQPKSVLFEVAMCVMFYLLVLCLEFSPVVLEHP